MKHFGEQAAEAEKLNLRRLILKLFFESENVHLKLLAEAKRYGTFAKKVTYCLALRQKVL